MTTHQVDPDVVRWGLHLIDCSPTRGGSSNTITCYDKDMSRTEYVEEGYCDATDSIVKNDEVIAHALQEELSRLQTAEASGSGYAEDHDQQASILAQDWFGSSRKHFDYDGVEIVPDNCGEPFAMGEEHEVFLEIEDESTLDGEWGRRLNEMVPVPHVPKINGEIPSADDAMSDHERLLARLELYDLAELKVSGDGNCQLRSLSDQVFRTPDHHKLVREHVVNQLKSYRELYESYVPMAYDDYLKKMSKTGEWGDHVTLQAAADTYGIKIFVITSFKDTCYIEILPQTPTSNRTIFLSFWAEVHYNSIYPQEEFPVVDSKKKKKWWKP